MEARVSKYWLGLRQVPERTTSLLEEEKVVSVINVIFELALGLGHSSSSSP